MSMRVVVAGAGVYGAAVAAALARRGAAVTVVDAGPPGGGTSGATFSWLNSCGKQPRVYHELNVAGMRAHRRLAAEVALSDWYHGGGNVEWAADDAGRDELRAKVEGVMEYGYAARWLTRAEVVELEPGIDPAALPADGIAYFPDEGWIQPTRLIAHLLANGVEVVSDDAVVGLDLHDGTVWAVRLASGRSVDVDAVVNCAGPQADKVAALAGLTLPMRNTSGVLVYTSPVAVPVSRVVHAPAIHLRPDGGGRLLLHSTEIDEGGQAAAENLLEAGRELYPGTRAASVESVRVGERPIPADGLPVLGRVAQVPGYYFAVSHSGATLCLHAGELVAAEVLGEDQGDALAAFRFERFGE